MERLYGTLYDAVMRRWRVVLVAMAVVILVSSAAMTRLGLDVSFRPFFATNDAQASVTSQYEAKFGQSSGAYLIAIVSHDNLLAPDFLRQLDELSRRAAAIPHVVEVTSLTTVPNVTLGANGTPTVTPLIDPSAYASGSAGLPAAAGDAIAASPVVRGTLIARDGKSTLVMARLDLPFADVQARKPVIKAFSHLAQTDKPAGSTVVLTGASIVENTFGQILLRNLVISIVVLNMVLLLIVWFYFRRIGAVLTTMSGVWAAMPITLGAMALLGIKMTAVTSQTLTMVLIIGVTQGIHMQEEFYRERELGHEPDVAVRRMFVRLSIPVAATALVTLLGFLSLRTASIQVIRDFSLAAVSGILIVYCTQSLLIPIIQRNFLSPDHHRGRAPGSARFTVGILRRVEEATTSRPAAVVAVGLVLLAGFAAWGIPRVRLDQRFNAEVSPSTPVRANQTRLEKQFSGFLGPELWLRPVAGHPITDPRTLDRLRSYTDQIRALPGVLHVTSITDYLPGAISGPQADRYLDALRSSSTLGRTVNGLIDPAERQAAVRVQTTDMGTQRSAALVNRLRQLGATTFGSDARIDVVNQWWLAQRGMSNLLSDMVKSVLLSLITILPIVAWALRSWRMFLAALIPSAAPLVGALAIMGVLGIPIRIGTAMILAIALGLVVDDTIHLLFRLHQVDTQGSASRDTVREVLRRTGRPCSFSSYVLIFGFATMAINQLNAIRDMGIVASFTMAFALAADLFFDPSLFLLLRKKRPLRDTGPILIYRLDANSLSATGEAQPGRHFKQEEQAISRRASARITTKGEQRYAVDQLLPPEVGGVWEERVDVPTETPVPTVRLLARRADAVSGQRIA
ncbi:MAG TPA: MMPL family transporter [Acidimicrobiales bacterium]|nr:MMPL family transporter [Acidimicrobiales bacterium]